MADAAAQAAMKRAIAIDNLADLEIQAANQINQSLQTAAPGSAPIIEAQADAWLVRANAYTQAAIADLMRVRAIDLADAGDVPTPKGLKLSSRGQGHDFGARRPRVAPPLILWTPTGSNRSAPPGPGGFSITVTVGFTHGYSCSPDQSGHGTVKPLRVALVEPVAYLDDS